MVASLIIFTGTIAIVWCLKRTWSGIFRDEWE